MSFSKVPVTVIIAVKNEAANIGRCLAALGPAQRVLVVDSHSTDATTAIAEAAGAEVHQFDYSGVYPKKRQWALDNLEISTEWVLVLDADEVVSRELWNEIHERITGRPSHNGYLVVKAFHFLGRRLRFGGFSHAAVLLFRMGRAVYEQLDDSTSTSLDMEVHERLIVDGSIDHIRAPLVHQDLKGLAAYIERHNQYSTWEAGIRHRYLKTGVYGRHSIGPRLFGNTQERRRFLKAIAVRMPFEPLAWFTYHFILRFGFLEGRRGFIASQIRASYISQVRAKMYELRLNEHTS